MGLDEARHDEPAAEIHLGPGAGNRRLHRREPAAPHSEVDELFLAARDAALPEDEIKLHDWPHVL